MRYWKFAGPSSEKNEEVPESESFNRKNVDNDIEDFSDYFTAHELQKEMLQEMKFIYRQ